MKNKIVTILGDSLSMARIEAGILLKDTYAYKLNTLLGGSFFLNNKSRRGNTSVAQARPQNLYDDINSTNSQIYIIQLGIVDCSPRIISKVENLIINKLFSYKVIAKYIAIKSKYRYFLTKYFPMVYVSEADFEKAYRKIIMEMHNSPFLEKIVLINIADTSLKNKRRSYGFLRNIEKYNKVIFEISKEFKLVTLFDLFSMTNSDSDLLIDDGIHISIKAHDLIARKLSGLISNTKNIGSV